MKILFLCPDIPSRKSASTVASYNFIKYLSKKHDITLLSFKLTEKGDRHQYDLNHYCKKFEIIRMPLDDLTQFKKVSLAFRSMFSLRPFFAKLFHSTTMANKVRELLKSEDFDLLYIDTIVMSQFAPNKCAIPKIINPHDAESETAYQIAKQEKSIFKKFFFLIEHIKLKRYESFDYKRFDACIVVSSHDKDKLKSSLQNLPIFVIPNGVDTNYFKPIDISIDPFSTVFVGQMSYPPNIHAVLYFYKKIYPRIREEIADIKFCIVGRKPSKEIKRLAVDKSVKVTGYVEDVRPYIGSASVVVAPMKSGMGIKNKILEAMAMGKPVVSTSIGAHGIDISPKENIIIEDDPKEFARRVIELLTDERLKKRIGDNARKLVEEKYSWENMADILNELFEEIVRTHARK